MVTFATLAALALALPVASGCSQESSSTTTPAASANDQVVARVNGVDIRQSDIALAEEDLGAEMQQVPPDQRRDHLITYLADIIMVSQAAEQKKLGDTEEFKRRLAMLRNKVLMGLALQDEVKAALTCTRWWAWPSAAR
jgi:peptidyl-prolyl cis-trans isomerase C